MKTQKAVYNLGIVFSLVLALTLVSSAVDVTYEAHYAVIQEDGTIDYQNTVINNFDTLGVVCTNSDCSNIAGQPSGLSRHTNTDTIILSYPTQLQNSNGYGIYFYKPGYIH